jgi:hypothetical protein
MRTQFQAQSVNGKACGLQEEPSIQERCVRGRALSAADMSMDEAIYPYLLVSVYDFISSFMATAVMCS